MLLKNENQIIRVLKSHGNKALVIDCIKRTKEIPNSIVKRSRVNGSVFVDFLLQSQYNSVR